MSVLHITKETYAAHVEESGKVVLLDFWASWCGPCRMLSPTIDAIAAERPDILVGKVNVDQEMELAREFGIASIPTLVVLKDGHVAARAVGVQSRDKILAMLP